MKIFLSNFLMPENDAFGAFSSQSYPILTKLLRGRCEEILYKPLWQMVEPDLSRSWPGMAPITLAYDMPEAEPGFWLRADPVLLRPSIDDLILLPGDYLAITQHESDALIQSLNIHFAENGLTFYAPTPTKWYVHCQALPHAEFVGIDEVVGQPIYALLPTGPDAILWHRYLNEIQMLFYTHAVNESRASLHQSLISSVWFWGGGQYPLQQPKKSVKAVYTDSIEVMQEAKTLGYQSARFQDNEENPLCHDDQVWILTGLQKNVFQENIRAWQDGLNKIEHYYVKSAWQALKAKKIKNIELILLGAGNAYRISTHPSDRWRFWRKISAQLVNFIPFRS